MQITIIPLGAVSSAIIDESTSVVRDRFSGEIGVQPPVDLPPAAYHDSRDQYDAEQLVDVVESVGRGDKHLAITRADLFIPNRDYIFGLAEFGGDSGVVSFRRLTRTENGGSVDPETAKNRVRKEVVHELGHLMGYRHCQNDHCVMRFSGEISQTDAKYDRFCRSCRS